MRRGDVAMQEVTDVVLSFIDRCRSHNRLEDLIADFSACLAKVGITRFMMTRLPAMNERNAEPYIIAHTWSAEWLDQYRAQNYFWADPVSQFSFSQHKAFTWAEARRGSTRTQTALRIASEAKSIGMVDGLGFPMGDPSAVQAVVSLASDQVIDMTDSGRALLQMMCVCCEMRAVELTTKPPDAQPLSEKEREVLRWIANGKSVRDAADIMGLADPTITTHLNNARAKLGTTNVTQTVARGLMTRQFYL